MAYTSLLNFSGHQDSVNAVAFSPDSRLLASGGDDFALFIVDIGTGHELHKLAGKCPVTSLQWDSHITDKYRLFIGYANGQVLVASIDEKNFTGHLLPREGGGFVEDMAFGVVPGFSLLAVCTGSDVEVWRESLSRTNQSTWSLLRLRLPSVAASRSKEPVVPRSVHLTAEGAHIIVGYLAHGIICWDLGTSELLWYLSPRCARVGRSAISADGTLLIVSNLYDGFDLYRLEDQVLLKTYRTQIAENVPLPVVIMQNARDVDVLTGSSCGEIRIHHTRSAAEDVHVLPHTNNLIQTLAYSEAEDGSCLIAAGSSEGGNGTTIKVWRRLPMPGFTTAKSVEPQEYTVSARDVPASAAVQPASNAADQDRVLRVVAGRFARVSHHLVDGIWDWMHFFLCGAKRFLPTRIQVKGYIAIVFCLLVTTVWVRWSGKEDSVVARFLGVLGGHVATVAVKASVKLANFAIDMLKRYIRYVNGCVPEMANGGMELEDWWDESVALTGNENARTSRFGGGNEL